MPGLNLDNTKNHLDDNRATIVAIEDVLKANVDPTLAVERAHELSAIARQHIDLLDKTFREGMADMVVELPNYGKAFWAANDLVTSNATPEATSGRRYELYIKAGEMEKRAAQVLAALFPKDDEIEKTLEKVRPGTGYRDRAADCNVLFLELDKRRETVVASTMMTDDDIARLGSIATQLVARERPATGTPADAKLRDQAFTYFFRAWDKVRERLALVLHEAGLAIKLPTLY